MKLTGKCLSDFGDQCALQYKNFIKLPESCQNALIIEFFDSVGIYTGITLYAGYWRFYIDKNCLGLKNTRTEATNSAIEKANEIYNKNNQ